MKITVSQAIIKFMHFLNIKCLFGIPGSNMALFHEIAQDSKIKTILSKNECGAAFMASGYTKASGKISACFGSTGPGATNLITGIAAAYVDSQPILVLAGQVPKKMHGKNAFQESTGKKRTANQFGLFKNIAKYSGKVYSAKDLMPQLRNAFLALTNSRPGPAYLEIASDIMDEKINFSTNYFKKEKEMRINIKKLKKTANLISNAKRPLILAGAGAIHTNSGKQIKKIAEMLCCPIVTSLKGKGIIPEDHFLSLGCTGIMGQKGANKYIASKIDVLLAIGVSFHQNTTQNWNIPLNNTKIIRIDVDSKDLTKNYKETISLNGNIKDILKALKKMLKSPANKIKKARKKEIFEYKKKDFFNYVQDDSKTLRLPHIILELRKRLPHNSIVCSESIALTEKYFKIFESRTHITATGFAPIGCSLSEAIGAKIACPNKIVVSIQGDAGFQMLGMELMTAINYKTPIISIIINNGILGPIFKAQKKRYGKTFCSEFVNPSYVNLAKSFGAIGLQIKNKKQIRQVINKALKFYAQNKSVLIEILDRDISYE